MTNVHLLPQCWERFSFDFRGWFFLLEDAFSLNWGFSALVSTGIKQVKELCMQLRTETMMLAKQKKSSEVPPTVKDNMEEISAKKQVKVEAEAPISVDDPGPSLMGCSPSGWNFILVRD